MSNSFGLHNEDDLFYFESDHLALRGNKEYSEVLKTVLLLSIHREKAVKDFNKVCELQKEYLKGEIKELPEILELPKIPRIDFAKFNVNIPEEELKFIYSENKSDKIDVNDKESSVQNANSKHGKPWTAEEQKRLEELLVIYPAEVVEAKRYQKIAKALKTRSAQQVCSRLQKYFLKLYKAGIPVPGRIPKYSEKYRRGNPLHKHQKNNHYLQKQSTFFPELIVPVSLDESQNIPGPSFSQHSSPASNSSNYLIPSNYHHQDSTTSQKSDKTESELKLDLLKRVKLEKLKQTDENPFYHIGFSCDYCQEEPIIGSRWHCISCHSGSVDFCTDCMVSQMYSENPHPISHNFYIYSEENNSDNEENSGNCASSNESEKLDDIKPVINIKTEGTSDMEIEDVSYSYLHSNLMFHEND